MDSWSESQLLKMEAGGNDALNSFLANYGIPKQADITAKYNSNAASVYRDRIQALAEGRQWKDPPVVKEKVGVGFGARKPPLGQKSPTRKNAVWDSWDSEEFKGVSDIRKNQSVGDFRGGGGGREGGGGGAPARSRSTEDMYTRSQLEASAANKDGFFARKLAENESRPEGLPPSQGGKYVGFGSSPSHPVQRSSSQGDMFSVVSQGLGRLSLVAASAAQTAANVVQAGTKELTSKVIDGGYDTKVNETVSVVTTKTNEIGQMTWGIMKGVMALASHKVEELTKDGSGWTGDEWQHSENQRDGYYQEFGNESKRENAASKHSSSHGLTSWDDWNERERKGPSSKNWGGWDDVKDDGYDDYSHASSNKDSTQCGNSAGSWTDGGFH